MAMDSKITFEGDGPFHLPTAQQATATGHLNNGVTITFKALLGDRQRTRGTEVIEIQLVTEQARVLLDSLRKAIRDSEEDGRRYPPSLSTAANRK